MVKQNTSCIGNYILPLKCSLGICYGMGQKYLPIWVSVLVSDLIQNSDFGRTLPHVLTYLE